MRWADSASPTTGTSNPISLNQWYSAAVTYNGYVMSLYLNGVLQSSIAATNSLILNEPMTLGTDSGVQYFWNSQIADFQIYNTSLSTAEVQGLYAEGMGGAPTRLQNLVGWWPLNGNANDYSGNGNNGAATSVLYTSAWTK